MLGYILEVEIWGLLVNLKSRGSAGKEGMKNNFWYLPPSRLMVGDGIIGSGENWRRSGLHLHA